MNILRRTLLKSAGIHGLLMTALVSGLLRPRDLLAGEWNKAGFEAREMAAALRTLDAANPTESRDLTLKAPEIADDAALVPIEIISNIPNTTSLAILVEKNPLPLVATFDFSHGALPEVSLHIKLAETSNIKVIAKADGKSYAVQREVKVTLPGHCDA